MKDFYAVLGVRMEDSADTIRLAYRKLAKQYHPDLNPGNREAEERFKEIGIAWETLGSPEKRAKYDEGLKSPASPRPNSKRSAPQRKAGPPDFSDFVKGFRGFDEFFDPGRTQAEAPEPEKKPQAGKNPIDASELFKKFMGFR